MLIDRRELERLIPALRRYAVGITGESAAADDLVQDCLVLTLARERQFRGDFERLKARLERRDEESPSDRPPRLADE